jgi:hypothetical protein
MRTERPVKEMRRMPVGETAENNQVPGADGDIHGGRRRPGRAASLLSSSHNTRSQKWRAPKKGKPSMRRGVLAKGSRTGGNKK